MSFSVTNPLTDVRWSELVARHPSASIFHQRAWLEALRKTYKYEPVVLTSAASNEPMSDGIVLCRVSSWITGTRMVSVPFADHCEPLLNDHRDLSQFLEWLRVEHNSQRWKYIEMRPQSRIDSGGSVLKKSQSYCLHELDLTASIGQIFRNLHRDSIQRRIKRAQRGGVTYISGRSEELIDDFYGLLLITRRRHHLLPQPRSWFKNLVECMGDKAQIRLARKDDKPIAAILTLKHNTCVTYKYGCSDQRYHYLGAMPLLCWKLIEESKAVGVDKIDFGRSDPDQKGLVTFKDKFGTRKSELNYYRYSKGNKQIPLVQSGHAIRQFFSMLPDSVSSIAGRLAYRHMG